MVVSGQYDRAIVALNQLVGKNAAYDPFARVLRARAYLGQNDTASAMADLNLVLAARPNDPDALGLRGIAWSAMHENDKALDDLTKAIAQRETVEGYFARAKIYEAQSKFDKATDDFRRATQLTRHQRVRRSGPGRVEAENSTIVEADTLRQFCAEPRQRDLPVIGLA